MSGFVGDFRPQLAHEQKRKHPAGTSAVFYPLGAEKNELANDFDPRGILQTLSAFNEFAKLNGFAEFRLQYERAENSSSKVPKHTFDKIFPVR